jgi:hypothetical protein
MLEENPPHSGGFFFGGSAFRVTRSEILPHEPCIGVSRSVAARLKSIVEG